MTFFNEYADASGKRYSVSEEKDEQFLKDHPDVSRVSLVHDDGNIDEFNGDDYVDYFKAGGTGSLVRKFKDEDGNIGYAYIDDENSVGKSKETAIGRASDFVKGAARGFSQAIVDVKSNAVRRDRNDALRNLQAAEADGDQEKIEDARDTYEAAEMKLQARRNARKVPYGSSVEYASGNAAGRSVSGLARATAAGAVGGKIGASVGSLGGLPGAAVLGTLGTIAAGAYSMYNSEADDLAEEYENRGFSPDEASSMAARDTFTTGGVYSVPLVGAVGKIPAVVKGVGAARKVMKPIASVADKSLMGRIAKSSAVNSAVMAADMGVKAPASVEMVKFVDPDSGYTHRDALEAIPSGIASGAVIGAIGGIKGGFKRPYTPHALDAPKRWIPSDSDTQIPTEAGGKGRILPGKMTPENKDEAFTFISDVASAAKTRMKDGSGYAGYDVDRAKVNAKEVIDGVNNGTATAEQAEQAARALDDVGAYGSAFATRLAAGIQIDRGYNNVHGGDYAKASEAVAGMVASGRLPMIADKILRATNSKYASGSLSNGAKAFARAKMLGLVSEEEYASIRRAAAKEYGTARASGEKAAFAASLEDIVERNIDELVVKRAARDPGRVADKLASEVGIWIGDVPEGVFSEGGIIRKSNPFYDVQAARKSIIRTIYDWIVKNGYSDADANAARKRGMDFFRKLHGWTESEISGTSKTDARRVWRSKGFETRAQYEDSMRMAGRDELESDALSRWFSSDPEMKAQVEELIRMKRRLDELPDFGRGGRSMFDEAFSSWMENPDFVREVAPAFEAKMSRMLKKVPRSVRSRVLSIRNESPVTRSLPPRYEGEPDWKRMSEEREAETKKYEEELDTRARQLMDDRHVSRHLMQWFIGLREPLYADARLAARRAAMSSGMDPSGMNEFGTASGSRMTESVGEDLRSGRYADEEEYNVAMDIFGSKSNKVYDNGMVRKDIIAILRRPDGSMIASWRDFNDFLEYKRRAALGDHENPGGIKASQYAARLEQIRAENPEAYNAMEWAQDRLFEIHKTALDAARESGIINEAAYRKLLEDRNYTTIRFTKGEEGLDLVGEWRRYKGDSFSTDVGINRTSGGTSRHSIDPVRATLDADREIFRLAKANAAKRDTALFYLREFPELASDISKHIRWNGKEFTVPDVVDVRSNGRRALIFRDDGKIRAVAVPEYVARVYTGETQSAWLRRVQSTVHSLEFLRAAMTEENLAFILKNNVMDRFAIAKRFPKKNGSNDGVIRFDVFLKTLFSREGERLGSSNNGFDTTVAKYLHSIPNRGSAGRIVNGEYITSEKGNALYRQWKKLVSWMSTSEATLKLVSRRILDAEHPELSNARKDFLLRTLGTPEGGDTPLIAKVPGSFLVIPFYRMNVAGFYDQFWRMVADKGTRKDASTRAVLFASAIALINHPDVLLSGIEEMVSSLSGFNYDVDEACGRLRKAGDRVRKISHGISSHDKMSGFNIPIGMTESGKSISLKIPFAADERWTALIANAAMDWAQGRGLMSPVRELPGRLFEELSVSAGALPRAIGIGVYGKDPGRNSPEISPRGSSVKQQVIDRVVAELDMLTSNFYGFYSLGLLKNSDDGDALQYLAASPALRTFIRVSDAGKNETASVIRREIERVERRKVGLIDELAKGNRPSESDMIWLARHEKNIPAAVERRRKYESNVKSLGRDVYALRRAGVERPRLSSLTE